MVQRTLASTACASIASGVSCESISSSPGQDAFDEKPESANAAVCRAAGSIAAGYSAAIRVAEHDEKRRVQMAGPRIAGSPRFPATGHFPATRMMNNSPNPASKMSSAAPGNHCSPRWWHMDAAPY
jgi:hypothetical protein